MKLRVFYITFFLIAFNIAHAQNTDGVMSFDVPAKNSLKFNKFLINPTFSFVREDESFVSFLNKRQWSGFENAPQAYFFSYSGKFRDQNGIGFGLFQRNFGVLSSFGAVANLARNVELNNDSNFSFGVNLAYVNSGLNSGKVVVIDPSDPSLTNIPKNSSISINPGLNYNSGFFDFGITGNNIFYYNFNNGVISDDPTKGIGTHIMYTGYMDGYGILERAKFTALAKADIAKENTVFSGSLLFNAPKGFWAQAGYNTVYGASAGLGLILAKKISLGYTVEKGFGNFSNFGLSHEITLAYKVKGYGEYEDAKPIVKATKKTNPATKPVAVKKKSPAELYKERQAALAAKQQQEKDRLAAEKLKREAALAEAKAKAEAAARLKAEQEKLLALQGKQNAEAKAKAEAEARLKAEADKAKALAEADRLRKEKAASQAKAEADRLAREKAEADRLAREKATADAKAKADEAARLKAEADKAKADAEAAQAKAEADRLAREKAEADRIAKDKAAADAKAKADEAARLKAEADKAKADAAAQAKAEADRLAREKADADRIAKEKAAADAKAKADEAARLKAEADKAKADAAAQAKAEADRIAREKAEADRLAKEKATAEAKAKADEAARLKAEADKAKADAAAQAKAEADRIAREKAEADRLAKEKATAEAKAKADAEAERLRKEAEEKARLEAQKTAEDKELDNLSQVIDDSKKNQLESVTKFKSLVDSKEKELLDMRKANDDSEKGIITEQKEVEFQSAAIANRAIESLKSEINLNAAAQSKFINEYKTLAAERLKKVPNKNDLVNQNYAKTIEKLEIEKAQTDKQNADLLARLEKIKVETEIEKKRRIKRATFDSNDAKYQKDRATLAQIKASTSPTGQVFSPTDFNYGDDDQANMQIVKNVDKLSPGFYMVLAAHKDEAKRDEFIRKAIQAGQTNIDFFYNVNNSTYYIYTNQYSEIEAATKALESKGNKPYNGKMVIIKVEKK